MIDDFELKFKKFHDLMPHRVREVLLVSTPYDAFILQEDGRLTEQVFLEYSELNLSSAPRVTHVETGIDAFRNIEERRFDLVIATRRMGDMDVFSFASRIKEIYQRLPVVLLAMDEAELQRLKEHPDHQDLDGVFLWSGDAKILVSIIKFIEDKSNVDHDIAKADLRVIIVVEDSIRYYSVFLAMLYTELMRQSQSLIAEGLNDLHRLMRMRARPKILLANNYEDAKEIYDRYSKNVLALICDMRFPRNGLPDPGAGKALVSYVRQDNELLPVVLQSAENENAEFAQKLDTVFCNKNSPTLLKDIEQFLTRDLGFGDFVFRMPDGTEVARVRNLYEMEQVLNDVPAESLEYHAQNNHISIWLIARSEFDLAHQLRPKKVSDFPTMEGVRKHLIAALQESRRETQRGAITDFTPDSFDPGITFVRMGGGSLGGKARGIAFVNAMLARKNMASRFPGMEVKIPQTIALGTDVFDSFMAKNNLYDVAYQSEDDQEIREAFLKGRLPYEIQENMAQLLQALRYPIAVRSSSLLEDSQFQSFAGIYETIMLPNSDPDLGVRTQELQNAVKAVYASTFCCNAKAYMEATPNRIEDEKMGVVIQELVGQRYGNRFYPHFAGVGQSFNYYPIGHQKPDEGVAQVCLGLGKMVVDGEMCLRFSPKHPQILPQFASPKAVLKNTQRRFYALDLSQSVTDMTQRPVATQQPFDVQTAEEDGTLAMVASTYNVEDDIIRDSLDQPGPRVVTFNNVLKHTMVPFAEALDYLLKISANGLGTAIEIEYAVDMGDWGKAARRGRRKPPTLYFLQLRPMIARTQNAGASPESIPPKKRLCYSTNSMGVGRLDSLRDILYVRRDNFDRANTKQIAIEIGKINTRLKAEKRGFILIGPGRWGSADPWLGIPVQWSQISSAKVIVEASPDWFQVEPSQGTHFFQNITSLRIGYLTLPPGTGFSCEPEGNCLDWDWLDEQKALEETTHLRLIRFNRPMEVLLHGQTGKGVIAKPGKKNKS